MSNQNFDIDEVVLKIQCAYRQYLARKVLEEYVHLDYIKIFDRDKHLYIYKNKKSGLIYQSKPKFFGKIDIPIPRDYEAPIGYDPGEPSQVGYALVITVGNFLSNKIPKISHQVENDHDELEGLLIHGFICKFKNENVITIKDPTTESFLYTFSKMKQIVKEEGFLVVYVCTHLITVHFSGESLGLSLKSENGYLCMKDTSWENSKSTAKSAISISRLIRLLNDIPCKRKTILLNYGHVEIPKGRNYKSRIFYPPIDAFSRISKLSNCAVIGCCNIGTPVPLLIHHYYHPPDCIVDNFLQNILEGFKRTTDNHQLSMRQNPLRTTVNNNHNNPSDDLQEELHRKYLQIQHQSSSMDPKGTLPPKKQISTPTSTPLNIHNKSHSEGNNHNHIHQSLYHHTEHPDYHQEHDHLQESLFQRISTYESRLENTFYSDWKMEKPQLLTFSKSPYPTAPLPILSTDPKKAASIGNPYKVEIPSRWDGLRHYREVVRWAMRRACGPPGNFLRQCARYQDIKKNVSPKQRSLLDDQKSFFGLALRDAFKGGILPTDNRDYITVLQLFEFLKKNISDRIARKQPNAKQTPVLFLPPNAYHSALNPVYFRCGPPPAPLQPETRALTRATVEVKWRNPKFDGVPPTEYRIYMKANTRNFDSWAILPQKGIIRDTVHVVRDLPFGVPVQFRIEAYNAGGWSMPSVASDVCVPGASEQPMSNDILWQRIVKGGALAIIEQLDKDWKSRTQFHIGMRKLISIGQYSNGFLRENVAVKATNLALKALVTFSEDPDICSSSLHMICHSFDGGHAGKIKEICLEEDLISKIEHLMLKFRHETVVIGAICTIRRHFNEQISQLPPTHTKEIVKKNSDDSDEDNGGEGNSDWVNIQKQNSMRFARE